MPASARFILPFLLIGTGLGCGAESDLDPFAVDAPAVEMPRNPNHLEPIPAYDPDGYDQAVFQSLIGEDAAELWMVGKASFSPEYAVIIRRELTFAKSDDISNRKIESEKWIVEYVEAKKQIWQMKDIGGGRSMLDIRVTKDVMRHRAEVSEEFSALMVGAWRSVLRKTRYAETDYQGLDGATFQFYCHYHFFGEIWSPDSGLPNLLTELGHKLADVAKAEVQERPELVAECTILAKKIKLEIQQDQTTSDRTPATRPVVELEAAGHCEDVPEKPKEEAEAATGHPRVLEDMGVVPEDGGEGGGVVGDERV